MASVYTRLARHPVLKYVIDRNPFYLLSAVLMLLGCLLLSNATTWSPIAVRRLLTLIATVNLYELLVVGLGLFLIAKRGLARDGIILLCMESAFIADVGFLNSEVYTESLRIGLMVNGVLMVVAAIKLAAIFRVLKMPWRSPAFGITLLTMFGLLGHAAIFKIIGDHHHGRLPDGVLYAAWWGLAGLTIAYAVIVRNAPPSYFRGRRASTAKGAIGHVLVLWMLASFAGHLGTSHWIYSCPFQAPDVSPALIALATLLAGVRGQSFAGNRNDIGTLCFLLPIAAVFTAAHPSSRLELDVMSAIGASPLILTAGAAYLTLVYCFAVRHFVRYAAFGAVAVIGYRVSPTWASIQAAVERAYEWVSDVISRLVPRTQGAWGAISLIGAFVLLGVGAAISLLRRDEEGNASSQPPIAPPPPPEPAVSVS